MIVRLLTVFFFFSLYADAQRSIGFMELDLESAIQIAKRQNKRIFIDTYASYCKPCKVIQKEFRNPELAEYFNSNFINVKVDMEGPDAKPYSLNYQIVFLPTLLFLNSDGDLQLKIDHLVTAKELLNFARQSNGDYMAPPLITQEDETSNPDPVSVVAIPPTIIKDTHIQSSPVTPISDTNGEEKILYVMGQSDQVPPQILKEEAYFRMQLMDGSHIASAQKYLDTQENWSTEENLKFIYDFLYTCKSVQFDYLIDQRILFNKVLGKENVDITISILINKELERGYPRPDLHRAEKLFAYIAPDNYKDLARRYIQGKNQ